MTGCTATLKTATVTFCGDEPCLEVETCIPYDDGWSHVLIHTLTCTWDADVCTGQNGHGVEGAGPYNVLRWLDSTPGATPHVVPLVSEAEVDAAGNAYLDVNGMSPSLNGLRAALEAAARVRQGDDR